jgi:SAM-dependent methyltransferase
MAAGTDVISNYDEHADALAKRYEVVSSEAMLADVLSTLPRPAEGRIALDIGAGTGRDAAWLGELGYQVVAAEPAAGMRRFAAERHGDAGIRWVDDALPGRERTHALGLSFDLVLLSAVWQHVGPADRARAFRKISTLMKPGGTLIMTLRNGPAPTGMEMHPTSTTEVEGLARSYGLEVLRVSRSADQGGRPEVIWDVMAMRMPDDGTGALPLVRGIVLSDGKSSTYKLALLRAVTRIAEYAPAAATPAPGSRDAVEVPLGLVALNWIRMYLPLVRGGFPQAPGNRGTVGLSFAKDGFEALLARNAAQADLRVGATFDAEGALAVMSAISQAADTIAKMPANSTRYPNGGAPVFGVTKARPGRTVSTILDLETLRGWGLLEIPGHLWRAMSRFSSWIDPMLVAEWSRLTRSYGDRMGLEVGPGAVEGALAWIEPGRTTTFGRDLVRKLIEQGKSVRCVWTAERLRIRGYDVDHCLPWAVWPCGDLWNLMPAQPRINRHEKRDRLPSAAAMRGARASIIGWWEMAYLQNEALRSRFLREAASALPVAGETSAAAVYDALDWRRLRLRQDQQVPEWTPSTASRASVIAE